MKKLLMLGVAAVTFAAAPAMANEHDGSKKSLFEKHDANGDGIVTKDEFMAHATKKFEELDTNKDGSISKEESDAKREEWKSKMKEKRAQMKKDKPADAPVEPAPETSPAE